MKFCLLYGKPQTEICGFQCFKEPTFLQLAKLALLGVTGYTYLGRLNPFINQTQSKNTATLQHGNTKVYKTEKIGFKAEKKRLKRKNTKNKPKIYIKR